MVMVRERCVWVYCNTPGEFQVVDVIQMIFVSFVFVFSRMWTEEDADCQSKGKCNANYSPDKNTIQGGGIVFFSILF